MLESSRSFKLKLAAIEWKDVKIKSIVSKYINGLRYYAHDWKLWPGVLYLEYIRRTAQGTARTYRISSSLTEPIIRCLEVSSKKLGWGGCSQRREI